MVRYPKSRYTFYDPKTYHIIVERGQSITEEIAQRLRELGFYEIAVGEGTPASGKIGFGRKKGAWAYAHLQEGTGKVTINGKLAEEWFGWISWQVILQPFEVAGLEPSQWDINGKVQGSSLGSHAQKRALQHAIASAIAAFFPEKRRILRQAGFCCRGR